MEKRKRAPASGKSKKPLGQGEKFFAFLKVKTFFLVLAGAICLAAGGWLIFNWQARAAADAIGLRVMKNDKHLSVAEWYRQNIKVQGSPETIRVDGYPALREGRSVYVNAANIAGGQFYTNIYIISYDQQAGSFTQSIFNRLLENWKFSDDIVKKRCSDDGSICNYDSDCPAGAGSCVATGKCSGNANKTCLYDSDCAGAGYCASGKAEIIRDTVRLGDLAKIKSLLESYAEKNGHYPKLESGTYIKGNTLSVWPSWRENLQAELGQALPVDPINKLGACAGYDATTCWNKNTQRFAWGGTTVDLDNAGAAGGKIYAYQYLADNQYKLCSFLESNYSGLDSDRCTENTFNPTQYCQGKCGNVNGVNCGNCSDATRECINNKCVCKADTSDCGSGGSCSCDLHNGGTCSGGSCCTGSCGNQCGITVCGVACSCPSGKVCNNNVCCQPNCNGNTCGDNGCGGTCLCSGGRVCCGATCCASGKICYSGSCSDYSSAKPKIAAFSTQPVSGGTAKKGENITVSWQAQATAPNTLQTIEIWRAYEDSLNPANNKAWAKIKTFYDSLVSGSYTDKPTAAGVYYYGIHATDERNWGHEDAPAKIYMVECNSNSDCSSDKLCIQNRCALIPSAASCTSSKKANFFKENDNSLGESCPINKDSILNSLGDGGFNEISTACGSNVIEKSDLSNGLAIPDGILLGQHTFIVGCGGKWDVFETCAYNCAGKECGPSDGCSNVQCGQCASANQHCSAGRCVNN